MQKNRPFRRLFCNFWSEWRDSNPRHLGPKPSALPTALHPDILLNFFCGDPTDAVCAAFLRTRPALNAQLLYIIRERNARDLSDCRQSNLYQTVDKVTLRRKKIEQRGSASEGFRMVTLGVLFTESFTAARFRMTACFSVFPTPQRIDKVRWTLSIRCLYADLLIDVFPLLCYAGKQECDNSP